MKNKILNKTFDTFVSQYVPIKHCGFKFDTQVILMSIQFAIYNAV